VGGYIGLMTKIVFARRMDYPVFTKDYCYCSMTTLRRVARHRMPPTYVADHSLKPWSICNDVLKQASPNQ